MRAVQEFITLERGNFRIDYTDFIAESEPFGYEEYSEELLNDQELLTQRFRRT